MRLKASMPRDVTLPISSTSSMVDRSASGPSAPRRGGSTLLIKHSIKRQEMNQIALLRGCSIPVDCHLIWQGIHEMKAFKFAANNPIAGYKPSGYNSLSTTLLQREKSHVEGFMEPIRATWKQKVVSICSDWWADAQRYLINFMVVTESGPMFLNSVNVEREMKNRHYITKKFENYIK